MLFKSDPLPINSCARTRKNLHIVIVGNSNLLAREAPTNPCAFSCGLNEMSLSGWLYYSQLPPVCSPARVNEMWVAFPALLDGSSGSAGQTMAIQTGMAVHMQGGWCDTVTSTRSRGVGAQWWHWAGGQCDGKQGPLPALWHLSPSALSNQVATVQQSTSSKHRSQYKPRYNSLCLF